MMTDMLFNVRRDACISRFVVSVLRPTHIRRPTAKKTVYMGIIPTPQNTFRGVCEHRYHKRRNLGKYSIDTEATAEKSTRL
jgi:hypothetical protein